MNKLELYTTLVISTAHLPEKLAGKMNEEEAFKKETDYSFVFYTTEYGYRVWVKSDHIPGGMKKAVKIAKWLGCRWLEFDQDGDKIEGLKTYEW